MSRQHIISRHFKTCNLNYRPKIYTAECTALLFTVTVALSDHQISCMYISIGLNLLEILDKIIFAVIPQITRNY